MKGDNENIVLAKRDIVEILKKLETFIVSFDKRGSYYSEKAIAYNYKDEEYKIDCDTEKYKEFVIELARFIRDSEMLDTLSHIRYILSGEFDETLGDDDMDELERVMKDLKFWRNPGDNIV